MILGDTLVFNLSQNQSWKWKILNREIKVYDTVFFRESGKQNKYLYRNVQEKLFQIGNAPLDKNTYIIKPIIGNKKGFFENLYTSIQAE